MPPRLLLNCATRPKKNPNGDLVSEIELFLVFCSDLFSINMILKHTMNIKQLCICH